MPNTAENDLTQLTYENKLVTSIYKIGGGINTADELINLVKGKLDNKDCFKFKEIDNDFFKGLVFSYKTTPVWSGAISELINESNDSDEKELNDNEDAESSDEDKPVETSTEVDNSEENESDDDADSSNDEDIEISDDFELKNRYISYILIKSISTVNEMTVKMLVLDFFFQSIHFFEALSD